MRIVVNGKERALGGRHTVAELLDELGIEGQGTAVIREGQVIPRRDHESTVLADGEHLEIVRMVGGG